MKKEYPFYLYISWKKEKVVVIADNSKMRKDFFLKQEWTVPICKFNIKEQSWKTGLVEGRVDRAWNTDSLRRAWVKDI